MTAETLRGVVERFVTGARRPAALEPGEDWIELRAGNYALDVRGGRLTLQLWSGERSVTRRVTAIGEQRRGRLELTVERFARREGRLWLVDRGRPEEEPSGRRGSRWIFREQFGRFLARGYPQDKIVELTTEADLARTLSPAFPRAYLRRGRAGIAAIAAPPDHDAGDAVTFGLIWLDYLRRRERKAAIERLVLYLPAATAETARLRLRHLTVAAELHAYTDEGLSARLDFADAGNLETVVEPMGRLGPDGIRWAERIRAIEGVTLIPRPGSTVSARTLGIEVARITGDNAIFGLSDRTPLHAHNFGELEALVEGLRDLRLDPRAPLHAAHPESWLEDAVRGALPLIDPSIGDPSIGASACYSQAPALLARSRSVLDLLAQDPSGRLVIVELKASQDVHLPMQALDYWICVAAHLERGDFLRAGYFPGRSILPKPPRLLLVAPALDFHPTTETLLRFFDPAIDVERVGVNQSWRSGLAVVFRAAGAARPGIGV